MSTGIATNIKLSYQLKAVVYLRLAPCAGIFTINIIFFSNNGMFYLYLQSVFPVLTFVGVTLYPRFRQPYV